jgi:hypothetical protein
MLADSAETSAPPDECDDPKSSSAAKKEMSLYLASGLEQAYLQWTKWKVL